MQNDVINAIKACESEAAEKYSKAQFDAAMIVEKARAEAEDRIRAAEETVRQKSFSASTKAHEEAKKDAEQVASRGKQEISSLMSAAAENKDRAVCVVLERISAK